MCRSDISAIGCSGKNILVFSTHEILNVNNLYKKKCRKKKAQLMKKFKVKNDAEINK